MVTIVIPTKNSARFLKACLASIRKQTYKPIQVLLIDSGSTDETKNLAREYKAEMLLYKPNVRKGTFEAPHKRNYGAAKAKGEYVYYVDADMELEPNVVAEAVALTKTHAAVIVPEESFGVGIWARAKQLERRCYWGDDTVEAPRFFKTSVWKKLGGLDESLGGGGDDWDLFQKLKDHGYTVGRTKSLVYHNEGALKLSQLIKKRFMYGRDALKYVAKRPKAGATSYFPIRMAYLRNWKLFVARPLDTVAFFIMRTAEYTAGFAGILYSFLHHE